MELVCINCPMGCHLTATEVNGEIQVTGNTCPRGKQYAINEMTNPMRTLTTTVKIKGGLHEALPVITSCQIPKGKMFDVMKALKGVEVNAPVKVGDVIVKNVCGLEADIIASRTMEAQ